MWTEGIDATEYQLFVFDRPGYGGASTHFLETTTDLSLTAAKSSHQRIASRSAHDIL